MTDVVNFTWILSNQTPSTASCSSVIGSKIEAEADVTFYAADVGASFKVGYLINDPLGVQHLYYAPTYTPSSATLTETFIIDLTSIIQNSIGTGQYKFVGVEVYSYPDGALKSGLYQNYNGCNTLLVTSPCQPPNGIQRYCGSDNKTLYVWSSVTCQYDSLVCSTNYCQNGNCTSPPATFASISLTPSSVSIQVGQNASLTATCQDSNGATISCPTLSWGSDNTTVATVSNGVITARAVGTAYVWAYVGNIVSDNRVLVTVQSAPPPPPPPPGCTNPKYKCRGSSCISDNCDGTGTYTTNTCNNACAAPPPPSARYTCSGSPTYTCNIDANGAYPDVNSCLNACKAPPPPPPGGGGGGTTGCLPSCDINTNYCIANTCIPKTYIIYGALGLFALMMLRR